MKQKQNIRITNVQDKDFVPLASIPLKTLEDFKVYNAEARKQGKPVKVPNESFHKKFKVKFQRFDQPNNVLKAYVRRENIEWRGQLIPGGIYHLPLPVIQFLNSLSEPIFAQVDVHQGGDENIGVPRKETKQVGERARFSCMQLEYV